MDTYLTAEFSGRRALSTISGALGPLDPWTLEPGSLAGPDRAIPTQKDQFRGLSDLPLEAKYVPINSAALLPPVIDLTDCAKITSSAYPAPLHDPLIQASTDNYPIRQARAVASSYLLGSFRLIGLRKDY